MQKKKIVMKKGVTYVDVLDVIEAGVVDYMKKRRGIDEKAMRDLLDTDEEVRASYNRKIERSIRSNIAQGVPKEFFGR